MKKPFFLIYGIVCYATAVTTILYAALFFGNIFAPRTIDVFGAMPVGDAVLVNTALIGGFALQHSGMARLGFKQFLARVVTPCLVRSTYVLISSFAVIALMGLWQPIGSIVWSIDSAVPRALIAAVYFGGWVLIIWATFLIDHFELFGLRQAYTAYKGGTCPEPEFRTPGAYRHVRHPVHTGWLVVLWATPVMTVTHLLLAIGLALYIVVGTWLEERGLEKRFDSYLQYTRKVPMLVPSLRRRLTATNDE